MATQSACFNVIELLNALDLPYSLTSDPIIVSFRCPPFYPATPSNAILRITVIGDIIALSSDCIPSCSCSTNDIEVCKHEIKAVLALMSLLN